MKHLLIATMMIVFAAYSCVNIVISQHYPGQMIEIIEQPNSERAFIFLDSIKQTPYYLDQYKLFNALTHGKIAQRLQERNEVIASQIDEYEKILSRSPQDPQILRRLSILYQDHGELDKAAQLLAKAQKIDPL